VPSFKSAIMPRVVFRFLTLFRLIGLGFLLCRAVVLVWSPLAGHIVIASPSASERVLLGCLSCSRSGSGPNVVH
jgi:hypothetical protein